MMWFLPADTRYIRIWYIIRTPTLKPRCSRVSHTKTKISRVSHTKTKISPTHTHTHTWTDFLGGMYQLEPRFARIKILKNVSCEDIFFKLKNVSCEYNRLNGWNSTLQAVWYIRRIRIICFLWTKPTIWLLILYSVLHKISSARILCFILMKDSVHWYYITLIKGRYYIKHDIDVWHGKQNPRRGRWL